MWLFTLVFLEICFLSVHGQSADQSDLAPLDIQVVLHLVSDLTQQIKELRQHRENDLSIVVSLEQKYNNLLEENGRLKHRIGNLENLLQIDEQPGYPKRGQIHPENGARRLFIDGIPRRPSMSGNSHRKTNTSDITVKPVHNRQIVESTFHDHFETKTPGHTAFVDTTAGRPIEHTDLHRSISLRSASSDVVAFSARLAAQIKEPVNDHLIIYDYVITNAGNGYNPTTGVFTCPKTGTYVFAWSIGNLHTGDVYTGLTRNGVQIAFSSTADDHYATMTSQTSVLMLDQGDEIGVKLTAHGTSVWVWALYTTFSGFILQ